MRLEVDFEPQGPELGTAALEVGNVVVGVGTAALEVGTAALQVGTDAPGPGSGRLAPALAVAEAQLWPQVVGNSAPAAEVGNFVEAEDFEHFDQN